MAGRAPLRFGPISAAALSPLYEQIVAAVKREVSAGRLKPGDTLPSVRTLATELLVSVITVKRAYEELEHDGIIYSRQGIGTFVAEAGAIETKRIKREAARAALCEAVATGREGGLTDKDLLDWLKSEL